MDGNLGISAPVLVMGATSGIGAAAVDALVARGVPVRAFARSAQDLAPRDMVEPFAGDALSPEDVASALLGARAVIYALGISESVSMLWQEVTLFSDSTKVLIAAMDQASLKRLVAVTGFGAGRSTSAMSTLERIGHRAILGKPYADKDRQEALILQSDLDWTIVRPVILTHGSGSAKPQVLRRPSTWRNGLISRAAVAGYLADAVCDDLDIRADVVLAR